MDAASPVPVPLSAYPALAGSLWRTLADRAAVDPFNVVATVLFALAVLHTFTAPRWARLAHTVQGRQDATARSRGESPRPSLAAEALHVAGEVEVVFGLWAVVLFAALVAARGWSVARDYFSVTVDYTEAVFVVVVMALASTRPIVELAERGVRRLAVAGGGTPAAWWASILTVGPLLGSFITEAAAMTVCAVLLARQIYGRGPSLRLQYATLALLFVHVSIGGTLTHFAAPPVLMVARVWGWDTPFMLVHVGWRAAVAIVVSTLVMGIALRRDLAALADRPRAEDVPSPDEDAAGVVAPSVPWWLTVVHLAFLGWTVANAHHAPLVVGGFLLFLGVARATAVYQQQVSLRTPLLVGFFLGGLVVHGRLQGWWIEPVLRALSDTSLFVGATVLTAFNDNALITYLVSLLPSLSDPRRLAVVQGAVLGGGLTVIANAPNPAGFAILGRFFGAGISPLTLAVWALGPTVIAGLCFRLL